MRHFKQFSCIVALCGLVFLTHQAVSHDAMAAKNVNAADKRFLVGAAQGSMAEVKAGKLVLGSATSPSVKQFAQMMVKDHTKALQETQALARQKGVSLPAAPTAKQQAMLSRLAKQKGVKMEKAYKDAMIMDHKEAISLAGSEIKMGKDKQVKAAATKAHHLFEEHLAAAKAMQPGSKESGHMMAPTHM